MKNIIKIMEEAVTVKRGTLFLWALAGVLVGMVTMFLISVYTVTGMI